MRVCACFSEVGLRSRAEVPFGRCMRWAWLLAVLVGCGAARRQIVLVEAENSSIGDLPAGLRSVESRPMWHDGRRVSVDLANLLVRDAASNTIRQEKLMVGDEIVLAGKRWSVVRIEHGNEQALARIVLEEAAP